MDKGTEKSALESIHQFLKGRMFSNGVNRRQLLNHTVGWTLAHRFSVAAALSVASCESELAESGVSEKRLPNIIFLLTDDQRADTLGCAGNFIIQTPNMDDLAADGVRFTNAFVTISICASRLQL